ncbi:MAG: elongation factor P [Candidatus Liptonbacteria bacterium]|nr:elongation factor P [Candidatus Liptonbacteria bacterium]
MLSYGDLKKGVVFVLEGDPWLVLDSGFLRMQQRKAVMQTKIKNLKTGKIVDRNFQASDSFEEAEIERQPAMFIYTSKGESWFHEKNDKSKRMSLKEDTLGDKVNFLKSNLEVIIIKFGEQVINVELPIKVEYEVVEAPPAVKGNTAQGGVKSVKIETGAFVNTPMFVETGDKIKVNTETGEYVERS